MRKPITDDQSAIRAHREGVDLIGGYVLLRVPHHLNAHRHDLVAADGLAMLAVKHRPELEKRLEQGAELQRTTSLGQCCKLRPGRRIGPDQVTVIGDIMNRLCAQPLDLLEPRLTDWTDELHHAQRTTLFRLTQTRPARGRLRDAGACIERPSAEQQPIGVMQYAYPVGHIHGTLPGAEPFAIGAVKHEILVIKEFLGGQRSRQFLTRRRDESDFGSRRGSG